MARRKVAIHGPGRSPAQQARGPAQQHIRQGYAQPQGGKMPSARAAGKPTAKPQRGPMNGAVVTARQWPHGQHAR